MSRFRWALLIVLILFILAFKFLPWYVLVGLAVVLVVGMKFIGRWLMVRLFLMPFKAKGAVLRNAEAVVHSIEPAAPPLHPREEPEEDDEEAEGNGEEMAKTVPLPRNYYRLVATITPQPKAGGFQHWEPGELRLIRPETNPMDDTDDECQIDDVEIEEGGKFIADEGFKPMGEQKLRLLIGVRPGVAKLVFQYYFEKFGEVVLREPKSLPAPPR